LSKKNKLGVQTDFDSQPFRLMIWFSYTWASSKPIIFMFSWMSCHNWSYCCKGREGLQWLQLNTEM